jgi:hypothetical protein
VESLVAVKTMNDVYDDVYGRRRGRPEGTSCAIKTAGPTAQGVGRAFGVANFPLGTSR